MKGINHETWLKYYSKKNAKYATGAPKCTSNEVGAGARVDDFAIPQTNKRKKRCCNKCEKLLTDLEEQYNFRTAFPLCRRCHLAQDLDYVWRALDAREGAQEG